MANKKINFSENLKIFLSFLSKRKALFIFMLIIILLSQVLQVAERFLFKVLIDKSTLYSDKFIEYSSFISILGMLAASYLSLLVFRALFTWLRLHLINILESDMIMSLKRYYFNHLIGLSHRFHITHKTGSLISRLTRGGRAMERILDSIAFNFAPLLFQLAVSSATILYFDYKPALVVFATILAFVSYSYILQRLQRASNQESNEREDIEKANIADFFTNIDSIKYFGKEYLIKSRFAKLSEDTMKSTLKFWNYFRWLDSGQMLILGIGTFFVIYLTLKEFMIGNISIGTLVLIYTVYLNLMDPLFSFVHGMREFFRVMIDFDDLFKYGKITNEIKDKKDAEELKIKEGRVEFKNLSFKYGKRQIFDNLSLKIEENEKVALVGLSGSGKTTLVKLLYRFYDPDKGEILIDGRNIKDFRQESLRTELSIVPQEAILFDDTIYNNIYFSNPKATKKQVMAAIKFAQLDSFVKNLPGKENTIVGERGVKLSGGERQRVSIARALLSDKKILVLDEATSSLDSRTEHQIQNDLIKLMKGRTTIIIAHRLSTVMRADKIVVMDRGKIVQIGSHNNLISKQGLYKQLWSLQKGGYFSK